MKKSKKRSPWRLNTLTPVSDPINAKLDRLIEQAEETGALADPLVQRHLFALKARPGDRHIHALLNDSMSPYVLADKLNPDIFRPYPDTFTGLDIGDVYVGDINETGLQWKLSIDDFPHIAVIGPTRGGKSYALYGQMEDLHGKLPYLFITIKNDTCRFLVDPPIADKIIRFEELKISLFTPPPGVDVRQWHLIVVELFCLIWMLQYARSPAHECVDELRAEFEALSKVQGKDVTITLSNLKERINRKKSKYKEGLISVIDMIIRATGDVFECSQGMPVEDLLLSGSTVLLIPNISDDKVARFFVDWLMAYAHAYFRENGPDDGTPQLAFMMDDAHRFLSKATEKNGMTALSHKYLVIKQSGVCIVAVSQCPSDLSETVIGQSALTIQVGGLNYENDLRTMCKAFGIRFQDEDAVRSLRQGEFIAFEQLGRYGRPFAGAVKRFPAPTIPFTESDRINIMTPILSTFSWSPAVHPGAPGAIPSPKPLQPPQLSNNALALAIDVIAYPQSIMTDRYRRLNVSGRAATNIKQELVDQGWVRQFSIQKRGGHPILLEPLTPLAIGLNRSLPSYGKGGFLHWFMQKTVADKLKILGYTYIEFEKFYGAKGVDLVATTPNGDLVGFEITVSTGNVESNFVKDFAVQPRFSMITAVCVSSAGASKVRNTLRASSALKGYLSRMETLPISHWL
ncbi:DUF853 family protein [bacterium AH-315-P07]|nr:DUF853 family protein [bacterium AH-315-P07]